MLLKILRFLRGYVCFRVWGGFSERFINLAILKRADIRDIRWQGNVMTAKAPLKSVEALYSAAEMSGMNIEILSERGAGAFLREHKSRIGLLYGGVFFLLFMIIMNRFVWCIDAKGSEKFSRQQIIEVAQSVGVTYGIPGYSFDEEKAAREIYKAFDGELSYVKVNIKGSVAVITVRDNNTETRETSEKSPGNLVADFDGVIVSDEVYTGQRKAVRGSAVTKGDILISGIVETQEGVNLYYNAQGNFTALHQRQETLKLSYDRNLRRISKIKKKSYLTFFGLRIPLSFGFYEGYTAEYSREYFLIAGSFNLPFAFEQQYYVYTAESTIENNEARLLAADSFFERTYSLFKNTLITDSDIELEESNEGIFITGKYICIDFLGKSQPIITENQEN